MADAAPDHSSLSVVRKRLPFDVFDAVNKLVLEILKDSGLLKGQALALDSSTMDANAAMCSIVRKDTNESYASYVEGLARSVGEQAPTRAERATFDKKREGRTTSNADWASAVDPDAKVTRTKVRRTHLAYKPEHAVDLESGAIVAATMNAADRSDHDTSAGTLIRALENLEHVEMPTEAITIVRDKGYHSEAVIAGCAVAELRTCVSEPRRRGRHRWTDKSEHARRSIQRNHRRVKSTLGKRLLRRRGETVERSIAHVLETGGMRRTHPRGLANNKKQYLVQVSAFNLGLVMRKLCCFGTPRGLAAAMAALFGVLVALIRRLVPARCTIIRNPGVGRSASAQPTALGEQPRLSGNTPSSTGC